MLSFFNRNKKTKAVNKTGQLVKLVNKLQESNIGDYEILDDIKLDLEESIPLNQQKKEYLRSIASQIKKNKDKKKTDSKEEKTEEYGKDQLTQIHNSKKLSELPQTKNQITIKKNLEDFYEKEAKPESTNFKKKRKKLKASKPYADLSTFSHFIEETNTFYEKEAKPESTNFKKKRKKPKASNPYADLSTFSHFIEETNTFYEKEAKPESTDFKKTRKKPKASKPYADLSTFSHFIEETNTFNASDESKKNANHPFDESSKSICNENLQIDICTGLELELQDIKHIIERVESEKKLFCADMTKTKLRYNPTQLLQRYEKMQEKLESAKWGLDLMQATIQERLNEFKLLKQELANLKKELIPLKNSYIYF